MKIAVFLLLLPTLICGQNGLEGLWEGTITEGDLTRTDGYRFELYLTVDNGVIEGVSTIYVSQDSIIKQKLRGRMYKDRSVGLKEVNEGQYDQAARQRDMPVSAFFRKYQFVFKRSLYESSLNGYWQEVTPTPLSVERKKGRIFLKRKSSKA